MKLLILAALTAVVIFASASALAQDPLRGEGGQIGQLDRPKDVARKGDIERIEKAIGEIRKELAKRPTDEKLLAELNQLETRLKNEFGVIATKTWQELRAQTPAADAGKEESMEIGTILAAVLVAAGLIFFSFLLFTRPAGDRGGTNQTPTPRGASGDQLERVIAATASDPRRSRSYVTGTVDGLNVFHRGTDDAQVVRTNPGVVVVPAGQPPQVVTPQPLQVAQQAAQPRKKK